MTGGGESRRVEIMPRLQYPEKCIRKMRFRTLAAVLNATRFTARARSVRAGSIDTTPSLVVAQFAPRWAGGGGAIRSTATPRLERFAPVGPDGNRAISGRKSTKTLFLKAFFKDEIFSGPGGPSGTGCACQKSVRGRSAQRANQLWVHQGRLSRGDRTALDLRQRQTYSTSKGSRSWR